MSTPAIRCKSSKTNQGSDEENWRTRPEPSSSAFSSVSLGDKKKRNKNNQCRRSNLFSVPSKDNKGPHEKNWRDRPEPVSESSHDSKKTENIQDVYPSVSIPEWQLYPENGWYSPLAAAQDCYQELQSLSKGAIPMNDIQKDTNNLLPPPGLSLPKNISNQIPIVPPVENLAPEIRAIAEYELLESLLAETPLEEVSLPAVSQTTTDEELLNSLMAETFGEDQLLSVANQTIAAEEEFVNSLMVAISQDDFQLPATNLSASEERYAVMSF